MVMEKGKTAINKIGGKPPDFSREITKVLKMITEHSGRNAVYYDLETEMAREWRRDDGLSDWISVNVLLEFNAFSRESQKRVDQILREIQKGGSGGETVLQVCGGDAGDQWLSLKYSPVIDGNSGRLGAIVSYEDITEYHRYEVAYLRQKQMFEQEKTHIGQMEADLNTGLIKMQSGRIVPLDGEVEDKRLDTFGRWMAETMLLKGERKEGRMFFSSDYLLEQYMQGNYFLERIWKMRLFGNNTGWVRVVAELLFEPYTGHIEVFFRLSDITIEKEAQMLVKLRSERDALTGLLNRATIEERVRECLKNDDTPGILLLIDLDDLKTINDTYGHIEGDRAIRGIGQALKSHFRQSDLIGRLGGDEFMVYLRGAAENPDAIAEKLAEFARRLSMLSIGTEKAHSVHCSIGCAIQQTRAERFETLYHCADIALYHVKRGTKNGFAFYAVEMEQGDYQIHAEKMQSAVGEKALKVPEGAQMIDVIFGCCELILSMNLTANNYFLVKEDNDGLFGSLPKFGMFDDFFNLAMKGVHADDLPSIQNLLSRNSLVWAYKSGKRHIFSRVRFIHNGGYSYVEIMVFLYANEYGDVCDFTLLRWE